MTELLRIAIVTSDIPNYRIPFLRELTRHGVDLHVIAAGQLGKGFVMDALPMGVSMTRLQRRGFPRFRSDVVRRLRAIAPQLILSEHAARHDYVWTTLVAPQFREIPRVLWTHGVEREELFGGVRNAASIGRWLQIDLSDAVLCYEAHGGALVHAARPKKRVGHINNSTDGLALRTELETLEREGVRAVRQRLGIRPDAFVICGLGRLVAEKEFARLIRVLGIVRAAGVDARVVLIGDGPERANIERASCDAGLLEHIMFAGAVRSAAEMAPWLFASDVSLSPAAIGLSVVDALFAGLPTITPIASRAGPYHSPEYRYLEDGKTAILTPDRSDESLAAACVALARRDHAARAEISAACVEFATANLGVERMASAMIAFVRGVLRDWRQPRTLRVVG